MERNIMLVETENRKLIECYIIATANKDGIAYVKVRKRHGIFAQWVSPKTIYEVTEQ